MARRRRTPSRPVGRTDAPVRLVYMSCGQSWTADRRVTDDADQERAIILLKADSEAASAGAAQRRGKGPSQP